MLARDGTRGFCKGRNWLCDELARKRTDEKRREHAKEENEAGDEQVMASALANLIQRGRDIDDAKRRTLKHDAVRQDKAAAAEPVMLRFAASQNVLGR